MGMETIAGWKANGEVHNCSLGEMETSWASRGEFESHVAWYPSIVDQGDLGSRWTFHATLSRCYF
jgi:hypothetical protein